MRKKIISLFVVFMLVLCAFSIPADAYAADNVEEILANALEVIKSYNTVVFTRTMKAAYVHEETGKKFKACDSGICIASNTISYCVALNDSMFGGYIEYQYNGKDFIKPYDKSEYMISDIAEYNGSTFKTEIEDILANHTNAKITKTTKNYYTIKLQEINEDYTDDIVNYQNEFVLVINRKTGKLKKMKYGCSMGYYDEEAGNLVNLDGTITLTDIGYCDIDITLPDEVLNAK